MSEDNAALLSIIFFNCLSGMTRASEQGTKSPESPTPGMCVFASGVYKGVDAEVKFTPTRMRVRVFKYN